MGTHFIDEESRAPIGPGQHLRGRQAPSGTQHPPYGPENELLDDVTGQDIVKLNNRQSVDDFAR